MLRRLHSWLAASLDRDRFERSMDDEMRFHLDAHAEDLVRAGVSPDDARRRVRVAFGGIETAKDGCRQSRGLTWLDELRQDVRYAVRSMVKAPIFTCGAVLSLGLGIGANAGIFSVLKATMLSALPVREPDRVVMIGSTPPGHPDAVEAFTIPDYVSLFEHKGPFEHVGALLQWTASVGASENGGPPDRIAGQRFTPSMFETLGVAPERGRGFTLAENPMGSGQGSTLVIAHRLWMQRFNGDPNIIGQSIQLDGYSMRIVGVMPPEFAFIDDPSDFWMPMNFSQFQLRTASRPGVMTVVARLRPGVSPAQAQDEMNRFAAVLERLRPTMNKGRGIKVQPLETTYFGHVRRPLLVLQGAVGVVLLIACANVAGLLLIRGSARQRELAVRTALGADRRRLVRQLVTESLLLSSCGGLAGVAVAAGMLRALTSNRPAWLQSLHATQIDMRVLAFAAFTSVATGILFGIAPALQIGRGERWGFGVNGGGRRATAGRGPRRAQRVLVAAQVAAALVLLVAAGLTVKSFWRLQRIDIGFDPQGLLSFESRLPTNPYFKQVGMVDGFAQLEISPEPAALYDRVAKQLRTIPGVVAAAGINTPPASGTLQPVSFSIEGEPFVRRDGESPDTTRGASFFLVTPGFFETMRLAIVRGRAFTDDDATDAPWVAVVNEAMARRFWPQGDPLGARVTLDIVPEEQPRAVVGIAANVPIGRMDRSPTPTIYVLQHQQPLHYRVPYGINRLTMTFLLRLQRPPSVVMPLVRRAVVEVSSRLPVAQVEMVDDSLGRQVDAPRYYTLLLSVFGSIAVVLAATGIYGVIGYSVAQRTREIAVRIALGAERSRILALVAQDASGMIVVGMIAGVAAALAVTRLLTSVLWEVTPTDPVVFGLMLVLLPTVAAVATLAPAARAAHLNPRDVLNQD